MVYYIDEDDFSDASGSEISDGPDGTEWDSRFQDIEEVIKNIDHCSYVIDRVRGFVVFVNRTEKQREMFAGAQQRKKIE